MPGTQTIFMLIMCFRTGQVKIHLHCGNARKKEWRLRRARESEVDFYDLGADNMLGTYTKYQVLKYLIREADV